MTDSPNSAANLAAASKDQSSVGLLVQNYCESILEQNPVDFSGFGDKLVNQGTEINQGLGQAKDRAKKYIYVIQPKIRRNISSIKDYYNIHSLVPTVLPAGASAQEWAAQLRALKDQADSFRDASRDVVKDLNGLHAGLIEDVALFGKSVATLNTLVNGDTGALAQLDNQARDLQGKIDGAIAGIALSGLAIVGGIFVICVGAIADFVTAGTSTPLVALGVGVLLTGVGGEIGSAITLANLQRAQSELLTKKAQLTSEVALAQGMNVGFTSLRDGAKNAVQAADYMTNAWGFLGDDLDSLAGNLEKGLTSPEAVRKLFLAAANLSVKDVRKDVETIQGQMEGTRSAPAPSGTKIYDWVERVAREAEEERKRKSPVPA